MAKGNPFWSKARGKLGDVVLQTRYGEQIVTAYQPKVHNPRTPSQMTVRINFATAVKFFKHAQQNLFKFSFEDQKYNESAYNAFMRHNAKRGVYLYRSNYLIPTYPSLGDWLLSSGNLGFLDPDPYVSVANDSFKVDPFLGYKVKSAKDTMGDVSSYLIEQFGFQNGDIVTIVVIAQDCKSGDKYIMDVNSPKWFVAQYSVDSSVTAEIGDGSKVLSQLNNGTPISNVTLGAAGTTSFLDGGIFANMIDVGFYGQAVGIVVSRPAMGRNTQCTTSPLKWYGVYANLLAYWAARLDADADGIFASWKTSKSAVVQGGIIDSYGVLTQTYGAQRIAPNNKGDDSRRTLNGSLAKDASLKIGTDIVQGPDQDAAPSVAPPTTLKSRKKKESLADELKEDIEEALGE